MFGKLINAIFGNTRNNGTTNSVPVVTSPVVAGLALLRKQLAGNPDEVTLVDAAGKNLLGENPRFVGQAGQFSASGQSLLMIVEGFVSFDKKGSHGCSLAIDTNPFMSLFVFAPGEKDGEDRVSTTVRLVDTSGSIPEEVSVVPQTLRFYHQGASALLRELAKKVAQGKEGDRKVYLPYVALIEYLDEPRADRKHEGGLRTDAIAIRLWVAPKAADTVEKATARTMTLSEYKATAAARRAARAPKTELVVIDGETQLVDTATGEVVTDEVAPF